MTLVELLHVHFSGIWPDGVVAVVQDADGRIWPSREGEPTCEDGYWSSNFMFGRQFSLGDIADDYATAVVREADFIAYVAKEEQ